MAAQTVRDYEAALDDITQRGVDAMRDFLCSPGFAGLVGSFGWPVVQHWPLKLAQHVGSDVLAARHAVRTVTPVSRFTDLADLRRQEAARADKAAAEGAVLAVAAIDPASWNLVRYQAWAQRPGSQEGGASTQAYDVLHVSAPDLAGR